jgi:hypothetical protein
MPTSLRTLAVSALFATSVAVLAGAVNAAPIGGPFAIVKAVPSVTQSVQWRGGGWGWGPAIVGGTLSWPR